MRAGSVHKLDPLQVGVQAHRYVNTHTHTHTHTHNTQHTHLDPSFPWGSLEDHSLKRAESISGKVVSHCTSISTRVRWMAVHNGLAIASR